MTLVLAAADESSKNVVAFPTGDSQPLVYAFLNQARLLQGLVLLKPNRRKNSSNPAHLIPWCHSNEEVGQCDSHKLILHPLWRKNLRRNVWLSDRIRSLFDNQTGFGKSKHCFENCPGGLRRGRPYRACNSASFPVRNMLTPCSASC